MKTRNGFVSNSSSSSFICLIPLKIHNEILEQLDVDSEIIDIARKFLDGHVIKLNKFNMDMVVSYTGDGEDNINDLVERILSKKEQKKIEEFYENYSQVYCDWIIDLYQDKVREINSKNAGLVFCDARNW